MRYYNNGYEIDQVEAFQIAGEAMLCSGGDIEELNSIIWRMEEDEEAREIFESISRIEVVSEMDEENRIEDLAHQADSESMYGRGE